MRDRGVTTSPEYAANSASRAADYEMAFKRDQLDRKAKGWFGVAAMGFGALGASAATFWTGVGLEIFGASKVVTIPLIATSFGLVAFGAAALTLAPLIGGIYLARRSRQKYAKPA